MVTYCSQRRASRIQREEVRKELSGKERNRGRDNKVSLRTRLDHFRRLNLHTYRSTGDSESYLMAQAIGMNPSKGFLMVLESSVSPHRLHMRYTIPYLAPYSIVNLEFVMLKHLQAIHFLEKFSQRPLLKCVCLERQHEASEARSRNRNPLRITRKSYSVRLVIGRP